MLTDFSSRSIAWLADYGDRASKLYSNPRKSELVCNGGAGPESTRAVELNMGPDEDAALDPLLREP